VQGRADCPCEFPELRVAIVDGFRSIMAFKDISAADECLVVHEVVMRHDEGLEWRVL